MLLGWVYDPVFRPSLKIKRPCTTGDSKSSSYYSLSYSLPPSSPSPSPSPSLPPEVVAPPAPMQSLLIPAQESYFLFRILNGSFQALESLTDQITLYFNQFLCSKSSLDFVESRSISSNRNEKKEISDGEEEPRGAVFNALDAMLKGSLDRLKTTRESICLVHTHFSDAFLEAKNGGIDISMIRTLCLEGKLGTALWLWKTTIQQHKAPDVVTHNHLLNALCKNGYLMRAEWLVKEMLSHGPYPTCATYNTLMKGYCLINKVDKALDIFSSMANRGIRPNRVSCNILVHALCQKGLLGDARKLLEQILDDDGENSKLITSTILMDGYFKNGNTIEALACWDDIYERVENLDVVAYNVVVHGHCLGANNISFVYKYLSEMIKTGYRPDVFTFNTIISKLCKLGRVDEACYVFIVMSRMGVFPDDITYKMIIQGLCICGDVVRAHRFLAHMLESSFLPKPLIWNVIVNGYGKRGDLQNAFSVKSQMVEFGVGPNVYTYNALIHAQVRNGNIGKAHYLKREMLLIGILPDLVTYNLLIGAACDLGDVCFALQMHDEMLRRGCKPDIITYTELLKCYCMRREMKEAEELFSKIQISDLAIDHVPFIILMKKYFKIGQLDKVFDLYLLWLKRGN